MLPKNKRIPREMFPLLSNAKVLSNDLFLLKFVSNKRYGSRFGFSVSKKISKKAVDRNRLRRAGYRSLRELMTEIKPNTLAVFSFRKIPKDGQEINQKLKLILKRSELIN